VAAAAWSVPVIAVATAAPAMAASPPVFVDTWGPFCKHPGNNQNDPNYRLYHLSVSWDSTFDVPKLVTIDYVIVNGVTFSGPLDYSSPTDTGVDPLSFTIPANADNYTVEFHVGRTTDSANADVTIAYTIDGVQYFQGTGGARNTPPCANNLP
jgi:hypothetical protein